MRNVSYLFAALILCAFCGAALAHDGEIGDANNPIDIDWIGGSETLDLDHEDADPWKGWAGFWVKNICGEDWGDFHFEIKSIFGSNIENIDFLEESPYEPELWLRTAPYTWDLVEDLIVDVDNDVVGATMDLYFYDSPIEVDQWAYFKIYTDNTDDRCAWFRVSGYPTAVPEPATIGFLGIGALVLLRKRK